MQWEFVIAIIVAVPVMLFPAVFIWYLNVGGAIAAVKRMRARKHAQADELAAANVEINN
jgi:hypothetical protein